MHQKIAQNSGDVQRWPSLPADDGGSELGANIQATPTSIHANVLR